MIIKIYNLKSENFLITFRKDRRGNYVNYRQYLEKINRQMYFSLNKYSIINDIGEIGKEKNKKEANFLIT